MRSRKVLGGVLAACTFAVAGLARAQDEALALPEPELGAGVEEVQRCMDKNLPARSARQKVVLENRDASGVGQTLEAELAWKRGADDLSRVLIRVERPSDLRGSAFLLVERPAANDLFTYLPELQKVRRINSRSVGGSLFGTEFSYEDLLELQGAAARSRIDRLPDAELDGRPVYVLAATPATGSGSAYDRIVTHVDRETCVALKIELFEKPGDLAKEMTVAPAQVKRVGERWIPHEVVLRDLHGASQTTLRVQKIVLDIDLPESLFSESALTRGR